MAQEACAVAPCALSAGNLTCQTTSVRVPVRGQREAFLLPTWDSCQAGK